MTKKTEAELVEKAIQQVKASNFGPLKISDVKYEFGVDVSGDPAIFATVVFEAGIAESDWVSEKLDPVSARVRKELEDAGVDRWPYVRFVDIEDMRQASE